VVATRHKLTARRGRLIARVDAYPATAQELGVVSAWRARDRAVEALQGARADGPASRFASVASLADLMSLLGETDDGTFEGTAAALAADTAQFALSGPITEAPFTAACSAGHLAAGLDGGQADFERGYEEERTFQSDWLVERLGLVRD
jgi:hypothetical protein